MLGSHIFNYANIGSTYAGPWQDGLLSLAARQGFVIRKCGLPDAHDDQDEGPLWLVVASLRWAVLAWPLVGDFRGRVLHPDVDSPDTGVVWLCVHDAAEWQCFPTTHCWSDNIGIHLKILGHPEGLIKRSLRFVSDMTFNDIGILADHCQLLEGKKATSFSRKELVQKLALRFGEDDEEFVSTVLASVEKKESESKDEDDEDSNLIDCLLEHCDSSEKQEYSSLTTAAMRKKDKELIQWKRWHSEKMKEVKVLCLSLLLQCFILFLWFPSIGYIHFVFFCWIGLRRKKRSKEKGKEKEEAKERPQRPKVEEKLPNRKVEEEEVKVQVRGKRWMHKSRRRNKVMMILISVSLLLPARVPHGRVCENNFHLK